MSDDGNIFRSNSDAQDTNSNRNPIPTIFLIAVLRAGRWGSRVGPGETVVAGTKRDLDDGIAVAVGSRNGHLIVMGGAAGEDIVVVDPSVHLHHAGQDLQRAGPGASRASVGCGFRDGGFGGFGHTKGHAGADDVVDVEAQIGPEFNGVPNAVLFLNLHRCSNISASVTWWLS